MSPYRRAALQVERIRSRPMPMPMPAPMPATASRRAVAVPSHDIPAGIGRRGAWRAGHVPDVRRRRAVAGRRLRSPSRNYVAATGRAVRPPGQREGRPRCGGEQRGGSVGSGGTHGSNCVSGGRIGGAGHPHSTPAATRRSPPPCGWESRDAGDRHLRRAAFVRVRLLAPRAWRGSRRMHSVSVRPQTFFQEPCTRGVVARQVERLGQRHRHGRQAIDADRDLRHLVDRNVHHRKTRDVQPVDRQWINVR